MPRPKYDELRSITALLDDPRTNMVAVDCETNGLNPYQGARIIGISLYFPQTKEGFYLPIRHPDEDENFDMDSDDWYDFRDVYNRRALQDTTTFLGHNIKFDLHFLQVDGFIPPLKIEDTMLLAQLVSPQEEIVHGSRQGAYALKRLAADYLGEDVDSEAIMIEKIMALPEVKTKKQAKGSMWRLSAADVAEYAIMDVRITWNLREFLREHAERWQVWGTYLDRCEFLRWFLFPAEARGILIDEQELRRQAEETQAAADAIEAELIGDARALGLFDEFNLRSPAQVKAYLSVKNVKLNGKRLPDTKDDTLKQAEAGDETGVIAKLREYRGLSKRLSSYYTPYMDFIADDGAIHATFIPTASYTGRINCMQPNLMQMIRDEFKRIFVPRPGHVFVYADYSQLELRIAVHFTGEEVMANMMAQGEDLHQYTADQLSEITGLEINRHQGKTANFGLIYGMGAKRAAVMMMTTIEIARAIVGGFRELYPHLYTGIAAAEQIAREWRHPDGAPGGDYQYIRLFNGRYIPYHLHKIYRGYEAHHDAFNGLVQGTATTITEISATRIAKRLASELDVYPVLFVHDSLTFEVPEDKAQTVAAIMKEEMEAWDYYPPMEADPEYYTKNFYDRD